MDITVIRASARRIIELAQQLPEAKQRDFSVEALTILRMIDAKPEGDQ